MLRLCWALASVSLVCGLPDPLGRKTNPAATDFNAKESATQSCACPAPPASRAEISAQEAVHLRQLVRKVLGHTTVEESTSKQTVDVVIRLSHENLSSLWKFILSDGVDGLEDATGTLIDAIARGRTSLLPGCDLLSLLFEQTQYIVGTLLVLLVAMVFAYRSRNHVPPPSSEVVQVLPASNTDWQQVLKVVGSLKSKVDEVKQAADRHYDGVLNAIERICVRPAPQTFGAATQTGDDDALGSIPCGEPVQEDTCSKNDAADWRNSRLEHASLVVANVDASVKFYKKLGVVAEGPEMSKRTLHFGDQRVYLIERSPGSNQVPLLHRSSIGFIVEAPHSQTISHLQWLNIKFEQKPRTDCALGEAHSIYVKDPDGYLVELIHYAPRT